MSSTERSRFDEDGPEEPVVDARGVSHWFGDAEDASRVLDSIDLRLRPGETVVLSGPSGSGKTTLLTLLGALREVRAGSIRVLGRELRELDDAGRVRLRRDIGFIFQHHNLFPALTALENVGMALELGSGGADESRAVAILDRLGLRPRMHARPARLSGGQRQRVAVARAVVNRPRLILADEPTAALDGVAGREVVSLLQTICKENRGAAIIVTHDQRVIGVADRLINLVDGRIAYDVGVGESLEICEFLKQCDVFESLSPAELLGVAEKMGRERVPAGETIIRQGEEGDLFYLLRQGVVEVLVDGGRVALLGRGEFFGEQALITGEPRNASVVVAEDVDVYTLREEDFRRALDASASFKDQVLDVLFKRT